MEKHNTPNDGANQNFKVATPTKSSFKTTNTIKDIEYVSGSNKANVISERLLAAHGLLAPELFLDADILEQLADRSEKKLFANSLSDIKNRIYQNVYNNLGMVETHYKLFEKDFNK